MSVTLRDAAVLLNSMYQNSVLPDDAALILSLEDSGLETTRIAELAVVTNGESSYVEVRCRHAQLLELVRGIEQAAEKRKLNRVATPACPTHTEQGVTIAMLSTLNDVVALAEECLNIAGDCTKSYEGRLDQLKGRLERIHSLAAGQLPG
jgi:hypothetical protein